MNTLNTVSGGKIEERTQVVDGVSRTQRVLLPGLDMLSDKIRAIPQATTRTLTAIEADLAREHNADAVCAIAMMRQLKVVAVIAHSAVTLGDPAVVPFWRVYDVERPDLADKLAGGRGFSHAQRVKEQKTLNKG